MAKLNISLCRKEYLMLLLVVLISAALAAPQRQPESSNSSQQPQQNTAEDSSYFDGVRKFLKDVQERRPDMYASDPEVTRLRQELQKHEQGGGGGSSSSYQPIERSAVGTSVSRAPQYDERRRGLEPQEEDRDVDQDEKDLRQQQLEQQRLIQQQQTQQHEQQLLDRQQQQQQQEDNSNRDGRMREYYQDISGYLEDVKRTRADLFDIDPDVQRLKNELKQYESTNGKVTPSASASSNEQPQEPQQPVTSGSSTRGADEQQQQQQRQPQQLPSYYGGGRESSPRSPASNTNIADPFAHDVSGSSSSGAGSSSSGYSAPVYATVERRLDGADRRSSSDRGDANGYQQQQRGIGGRSSNYPAFVPNAYAQNSANAPQVYGAEQQRRTAVLAGQSGAKDEDEEEEASDPRSTNRAEYDPYAGYAGGEGGESSHSRRIHEQALRTRQSAEQQHEEMRRAQQEQDQQQYQDWRRRFFSRRQCTPEQLRQQHQQWMMLHQQSGISSVNDIPS